MFWNRSSAQIARQWRGEIEAKLEAGRTPFFDLGVSDAPAQDSVALAAMQQVAWQRADITAPLILAGGRGPLWLAALCAPQPVGGEPETREGRVIYAGLSPADYLGAAAILAPETDWPQHFDPRLGVEPRSLFAPRSAPGFMLPWESLPFLEANEAFDRLDDNGDSTTDWIVRAVFILAVGLFLLAILL